MWEEDGSLIFDMFTWLFNGLTIDGVHESGVEDLIDEKFNLLDLNLAKEAVQRVADELGTTPPPT